MTDTPSFFTAAKKQKKESKTNRSRIRSRTRNQNRIRIRIRTPTRTQIKTQTRKIAKTQETKITRKSIPSHSPLFLTALIRRISSAGRAAPADWPILPVTRLPSKKASPTRRFASAAPLTIRCRRAAVPIAIRAAQSLRSRFR